MTATIAISAEWLGTNAGGPEVYTSNLAKGLAKSGGPYRYRLLLSERSQLPLYSEAGSQLVAQLMFGRSRWLVIPFSQPWELMRRPVDLFHATFVAPPICPTPFVLTVCELGFEKFPNLYPPLMTKRLSLLTRSGARRAKRILSISEYTKRDLVECYGIDPAKIDVIYWGVSDRFVPILDRHLIETVRNKYELPVEYILYVGKVEARKNISRLIQAYHFLKQQSDVRHKLVVAGKWSYLNADVTETVDKLQLHDDVIFLPEFDRLDLPVIYNGASVFVFPSLLEAFGIPPIEAMACGIPVVVSQLTAIPEIVGEAGVYVDPLDPKSIADGLHRALTDQSLRTQLIEKGFARARQFTWESTVRQTLAAYETVLER
ncbi:MAG: glycosyltransferase family 4 protein [Nitrospirae bacterium]|nr:glycosyltransferase family 4 protein [Nitrospirota bacterium]